MLTANMVHTMDAAQVNELNLRRQLMTSRVAISTKQYQEMSNVTKDIVLKLLVAEETLQNEVAYLKRQNHRLAKAMVDANLDPDLSL